MKTNNKYAVEVEGIEKKFGSFVAVNKIDFTVGKGEIFGFLGPNGAGKSTTIRMLCGILAPTSGKGHVGGYDIIQEQDRIKESIGYMSQKFSLYNDLTVDENINFYSGIYRIPHEKRLERKKWVLTMAGLDELRFNLTRTLSGGWKQRLALGCAIIHEPRIVFLDEPTSGTDPISRRRFWELIQAMAKDGVTVFVTTHYMDEAENCDRIALIYKGNIIAQGTPLALKTDSMKDQVLQVMVAEPESWLEKLRGVMHVKDTALFGVAIHAVSDDAEVSLSGIQELFASSHVSQFSIAKIKPSLEDVFVSLIENYDKAL
ncbi:MAG TPA: ABC transporter ATP-binding protein [Candidatus Omnitrophota bacterium]|nr:ABC transporter ATP-binding protein [Candidatus Omnitrophota bacterium]HPT06675.1 ABC transporter ATP-binding protein [Candidatus Omnitrophota bacterium]